MPGFIREIRVDAKIQKNLKLQTGALLVAASATGRGGGRGGKFLGKLSGETIGWARILSTGRGAARRKGLGDNGDFFRAGQIGTGRLSEGADGQS